MHTRGFCSDGFTLIELLVVISIIAILSLVTIFTLNPAELLRQSRDSDRVSDMATLNSAVSIFQADQSSASLGSGSTVYVSVPDSSATCGNLGLPSLPSGWAYHCVNSGTYRNTDSTGWLPINFSSMSSKAPFGTLPVDPINTTSTREYYTYTVSGNYFEFTSVMESAKYKLGGANDAVSTDGGTLFSLYEKGTNLSIEPLDYGDTSLVGYWNFEEGTGSTTSTDRSGMGNNGSWGGTGTHYATGKAGTYSGQFDGSDDYVAISSASSLASLSNLTACAWVLSNNPNGVGNPDGLSNVFGGSGILNYPSIYNSHLADYDGATWEQATTFMSAGVWYHVCLSYAASNDNLKLYTNGNLEYSGFSATSPYWTGTLSTLGRYSSALRYLNGKMDEVRIYNRVLSSAEISAIYNATK